MTRIGSGKMVAREKGRRVKVNTSIHTFLLVALMWTTELPASAAPSQQTCAFATTVDADSFSTLQRRGSSEVDYDSAAYEWAWCRQEELARNLKNQPDLLKRISNLRRILRAMRGIEAQLAMIRAGGGTLYSHAVPRSYPAIEAQLASYAALSLSSSDLFKQQTRYQALMAASQRDLAAYIKDQKLFRPAPSEANALFQQSTWTQQIVRYEAYVNEATRLLGKAATPAAALGYSMISSRLFMLE